ncbi:MAG TPA: MinD/ParA family protein [Thermodesulfobacteriota bacterium]|nr:MinD/ParA family protein [Thermodesulfobacteriota bacterium]
MDQAEGLRTLVRTMPAGFPEGETRRSPLVISVGSGKGGVGKTNVVANLAYAFTLLGKKTLVFDADLGLANIDVLLGLAPRYNIRHLLDGQKTVFEILAAGPGGMMVLPESSGVLELVDLDETQKIFLLNELDALAGTVDILLIDTAAGISSNVLYFNLAAEDTIVVVTPEPTSITDAYALIKVLAKKYRKERFSILINSAQGAQEAKEAFRKISLAVDRFLGSLSIDYLGYIPYDEKLPMAVKTQKPVMEMFPQAASSRGFMEIARNLISKSAPRKTTGQVQFFWQHLFQSQPFTQAEGRGD